MTDRSDLIVKHFNYLVNEYGFHIEQKEFAEYAMGNTVVVFKSDKIGIQVAIDKNEVWIALGDQADSKKQWLPFGLVLKHFAPSIENAFIIPKKTSENTWDEVVEIQLKKLSTILRQYCKPFLLGDFSSKDELMKIQDKQLRETIAQINDSAKRQRKDNS
jgi:hypothetical protein